MRLIRIAKMVSEVCPSVAATGLHGHEGGLEARDPAPALWSQTDVGEKPSLERAAADAYMRDQGSDVDVSTLLADLGDRAFQDGVRQRRRLRDLDRNLFERIHRFDSRATGSSRTRDLMVKPLCHSGERQNSICEARDRAGEQGAGRGGPQAQTGDLHRAGVARSPRVM